MPGALTSYCPDGDWCGRVCGESGYGYEHIPTDEFEERIEAQESGFVSRVCKWSTLKILLLLSCGSLLVLALIGTVTGGSATAYLMEVMGGPTAYVLADGSRSQADFSNPAGQMSTKVEDWFRKKVKKPIHMKSSTGGGTVTGDLNCDHLPADVAKELSKEDCVNVFRYIKDLIGMDNKGLHDYLLDILSLNKEYADVKYSEKEVAEEVPGKKRRAMIEVKIERNALKQHLNEILKKTRELGATPTERMQKWLAQDGHWESLRKVQSFGGGAGGGFQVYCKGEQLLTAGGGGGGGFENNSTNLSTDPLMPAGGGGGGVQIFYGGKMYSLGAGSGAYHKSKPDKNADAVGFKETLPKVMKEIEECPHKELKLWLGGGGGGGITVAGKTYTIAAYYYYLDTGKNLPQSADDEAQKEGYVPVNGQFGSAKTVEGLPAFCAHIPPANRQYVNDCKAPQAAQPKQQLEPPQK